MVNFFLLHYVSAKLADALPFTKLEIYDNTLLVILEEYQFPHPLILLGESIFNKFLKKYQIVLGNFSGLLVSPVDIH